MTVQDPVPDLRLACRQFWSRCPRHVPANLLLASAYLGLLGGLGLGFAFGLVLAVPSSDAVAIVFGSAVGASAGLTVGTFDGIVLALLSQTPVLRSASGVSRNRVTFVAVTATCLGSLALLFALFRGSGGVVVYAPVIAATLTAIPASRKLPVS